MFKNKAFPSALIALVLGWGTALPAYGSTLTNEPGAIEDKTIFVAIDERSEQTLGPMPISRSVYARALQRAKAAGAKGVVLKFFFDRETPDDKSLASGMAGLPVALQITSSQELPDSALLARLNGYARQNWDVSQIKEPLRGESFLGPVPSLLSGAYAVGTIDARVSSGHDRIESVGLYGDRAIPSLQVVAAEMSLGKRALLKEKTLTLGVKQFSLDQLGRISCPYLSIGKPRMVPIDSLLEGKLTNSELKNKVIILSYMRSDTPKIRVSESREMPAHEYFYRQVLCLLNAGD